MFGLPGGLQTRRQRLLGVLVISQAAGLMIVLPSALVSGEAAAGFWSASGDDRRRWPS
jgi:hypothetical protein